MRVGAGTVAPDRGVDPGVWVLSGISTLVLGSLVVYALFSGLREQNWLLAGYLVALVAAVVTPPGSGAAPDRLAAVGIYDQTQDAGPAAGGDVPMRPAT